MEGGVTDGIVFNMVVCVVLESSVTPGGPMGRAILLLESGNVMRGVLFCVGFFNSGLS